MRILIVGVSGSGKTTLAKQLAAELGVARIELDAVNWQAGWRSLAQEEPDEFRRRVAEAASGEAWVCDGNYSVARAVLWPRATHLIWLDYSRFTVMRRVIGRSIVRVIDQRELWAGNRESLADWLDRTHPMRWAWDTWRPTHDRYAAVLQRPENAHLRVLHLTRPHEAAGAGDRIRES